MGADNIVARYEPRQQQNSSSCNHGSQILRLGRGKVYTENRAAKPLFSMEKPVFAFEMKSRR